MDNAGQALQGMSQTDKDRFRCFFLNEQIIHQVVLQDSLLQQLLKQTALLTQLVCAPAAEKPPSQAVAKEQAPEQAVVAAEEPVSSQPLIALERRQGESLQKTEAEGASQHKAKTTPKTPQPAFPKRADGPESQHEPRTRNRKP